MHEHPEATEDEQEDAHSGRLGEEEGMRYPGHDDPDAADEQSDDEE